MVSKWMTNERELLNQVVVCYEPQVVAAGGQETLTRKIDVRELGLDLSTCNRWEANVTPPVVESLDDF